MVTVRGTKNERLDHDGAADDGCDGALGGVGRTAEHVEGARSAWNFGGDPGVMVRRLRV
jgi:hypothetical protein